MDPEKIETEMADQNRIMESFVELLQVQDDGS